MKSNRFLHKHVRDQTLVTTPSLPFLPYGQQHIDDDDVAAVAVALRSGWLTTGPAVSHFETEFAAKVGARHAIACSNGTTGLHLAALALRLGRTDAVIVPTLTFLATANAARYVGSEVIFTDVDADTGLLTPQILQNTLDAHQDKNIKAVFPVHIAGQCVDMDGLQTIAKSHDLAIVEDACHAVGGIYADHQGREKPVGACSHSDMAVFSLHPVKTITMGEGGLVTTNDDELNERLRSLRTHGMIRDKALFKNQDLAFAEDGEANPWYYEMHELGYNYRATDIQCALGSSQLKKLDGFVQRRSHLMALYDQQLAALTPIVQPLGRANTGTPGWHLCVVHIDFEKANTTRADVMNRLQSVGIGSQVHYLPVHQQPYYRDLYGEIDLPGADAYYARCLSLPLFPTMADNDVKRIVDGLAEVLSLDNTP